jgi:uncharacterized protein (DUF1800 family)
LTGWSLAGEQPAPDDNLNDGGFGYYANRHDPGPKQLLGVSYQERDGFVEGALALNDLALHPSTARHICRKLATHFISDNPSDDAVDELQAIWIASHGDLKAVSIKLLALQSAGQTALAKMRPPGEYLIACLRLAAGPKAGTVIQGSNMTFLGALRNLGQPLFDAPSPKGWSDQSADWTGPEALMQRVALAHSIAARMPPSGNPEDIAVAALGPLLSDRTRHTIRQAASPSEGLALLLTSPEVQKR